MLIEIARRAAQPDDLAVLALGCAKGRLGIAAVLGVSITVHLIEDGHEVVDGIEGGLRRVPRSRPAPRADPWVSAGAVAKALDLPRSRIERIVKEEIGISTDTALRLGRLFRTTPDFWISLQGDFERETLLREIGPELDRIEPVPEAA